MQPPSTPLPHLCQHLPDLYHHPPDLCHTYAITFQTYATTFQTYATTAQLRQALSVKSRKRAIGTEALPTETNVESGTSQSRSGTSMNLNNSGLFVLRRIDFWTTHPQLERNKDEEGQVMYRM